MMIHCFYFSIMLNMCDVEDTWGVWARSVGNDRSARRCGEFNDNLYDIEGQRTTIKNFILVEGLGVFVVGWVDRINGTTDRRAQETTLMRACAKRQLIRIHERASVFIRWPTLRLTQQSAAAFAHTG